MINTYVGPMFSGKSDSLINIYSKIWNKDIVMAFKPKNDDRDEDEVKSKNSDLTIPAIYIEYLEEIYDHLEAKQKEGINIRTIFIDEAQFLKGSTDVLIDLTVNYGIDFYVAGLNMTSEQKPFGLMPNIMAVSDNVEVIRGFCVECNKPSVYTYYAGEKVDDVQVGDAGYTSLCPDCLGKKIKVRSRVKDARKTYNNRGN